MSKNVGTIDRVVRLVVVAPLALIGAIAAGIASPLGIVLLVVAGIMAVTGAVGSCPLYRLLGIRTCPLQRASGT